MRSDFWFQIRGLFKRHAAWQPYEARNNFSPQRRFGDMDGVDQVVLDLVYKDLVAVFGLNGSAPPALWPSEFAREWEQKLVAFCFRRNIGEAEAAIMLRAFLEENGEKDE